MLILYRTEVLMFMFWYNIKTIPQRDCIPKSGFIQEKTIYKLSFVTFKNIHTKYNDSRVHRLQF